jgi:hypothetical protein
MLALGAFREETLAKLLYRHVQEDIENNTIPIMYTSKQKSPKANTTTTTRS